VPVEVLVSVKVLVTTDDASAEPSGMESIPESLHPTNASPIPIEAGTTTCRTVSLRKIWMRSRMSFSFMVSSCVGVSRYRFTTCIGPPPQQMQLSRHGLSEFEGQRSPHFSMCFGATAGVFHEPDASVVSDF
jgi:hypothetical protein